MQDTLTVGMYDSFMFRLDPQCGNRKTSTTSVIYWMGLKLERQLPSLYCRL